MSGPFRHWFNFRKWSIQRKLMVIILVTTGGALLLACGAFVVNDFLAYRRSVAKDLSTKARIIGYGSTAALTFGQPKPVEEIITALQADPDLISASVYDQQGQVLAQYVRADRQGDFSPPQFQENGYRFEHGQIVLYHQIVFNGEVIGAVVLQRDLQEMRQRFQRYLGIVGIVLFTAMCVAFVLSSKLQRVVSDPILHLAKTANIVAEKRNYAVRAQKESEDELGHLIDRFNEMLVQIQARETALQRQIAERKKAEEALHQSQERFSKAFQASSIAIAIVSFRSGRILDVNEFFLKLFGYERGEVVGHTALDLALWVDPQDRAKLVELARARGSVRNFEGHLRTKTGETRTTLVSVESVELGNETCLLFITHDISERLNLEAQLRQSQKMEAVGQLAAGVAHDFNNIMTIIQGHTDLVLSSGQLDGEMSEALQQVCAAADQATNLTRQLLTFSRKPLVQLHWLNLNEIIDQAAQMLGRTLGEHIALKWHCAPELPGIRGDAGMLQQLIMNLAVNARDAMPRGGELTLGTTALKIDSEYAKAHPEARPGEVVCLTVTDTGCGMDAKTLSRIFEPFFTTKGVGKGTGLGLAMVYGIVNQHQGWINVASEVGAGTTFKLFFPADSHASESSAATSPDPVLRGGTETIFVVEDEPKVRRFVCSRLRQYGYQVLEAASGLEALRFWEEQQPKVDLLLTDLMMPEGIFGRDLAERLQAAQPTLKVIFTSGYAFDATDEDFALEEGRNFLPKPYPPHRLIQIVRNCLDQPNRAQPPKSREGI